MRKIPTLFERDDSRRYVTEIVTPGCEWVLDGEGIATRKYDGTCVMFDGGRWWVRREVKPGKAAPEGFDPISTDPITGKTMGWEPSEASGFSRLLEEAIMDEPPAGWLPGTYELCGPKINRNPEGFASHVLVRHDHAEVMDAPRSFVGLRAMLTATDWRREGVVWHHPDGRMVKLKARDFPSTPER